MTAKLALMVPLTMQCCHMELRAFCNRSFCCFITSHLSHKCRLYRSRIALWEAIGKKVS